MKKTTKKSEFKGLTTNQALFRVFVELEALNSMLRENLLNKAIDRNWQELREMDISAPDSLEDRIAKLDKTVSFVRMSKGWTAQFMQGGISDTKKSPSEALDSLMSINKK